MKKLCLILTVALVLSVTALGTVLMWNQSHRFTQHRWHEGDRENVISDVLENYAHPGASVETMIKMLGEGNEADPALLARIRALCEGQNGEETDGMQVFVYNIESANGRVTDYLAVVTRGDRVVQTMFVSES